MLSNVPYNTAWNRPCQHIMSMNAINNENILRNYGGNNVNSLNHILEFDGDDELHLLQKSQYFDDESLSKQLAKTKTLQNPELKLSKH